MKAYRRRIFTTCLLLVLTMTVSLCGCEKNVLSGMSQTTDLMKGVKAQAISFAEVMPGDDFNSSQMELAVKLFKASLGGSEEKNVLISPLSIQLALAMTANGAGGRTLEEMTALLGGGLSMEELNQALYSYIKTLPSDKKEKLQIANSIWVRDDEELQVVQSFLQKNADYYGAQIYKAPFNTGTVEDINGWVKKHTDGMIEQIIREMKKENMLYLINALAFDAEWQEVYDKSDIYDGEFQPAVGAEQMAEMMHSTESLYLEGNRATGFIKPYKNSHYSFAALLPNEGVDIYDYMNSLTAAGLKDTLEGAQAGMVTVNMPKFSYDYEWAMNDALKALGMPSAFSAQDADFSQMASTGKGNIYIGNVLHKTFIAVDELGTKAGAVTAVEMKCELSPFQGWEVTLNRPFVYMILDHQTNLPVFMGAVLSL